MKKIIKSIGIFGIGLILLAGCGKTSDTKICEIRDAVIEANYSSGCSYVDSIIVQDENYAKTPLAGCYTGDLPFTFFLEKDLNETDGILYDASGREIASISARQIAMDYPLDSNLPQSLGIDPNMIRTVKLPTNTKAIGSNAFRGCSALKSIDIPDGVIEVKDNVFYGCSALTNIDLSNVKTIGEYSFYNCYSLKSIRLTKDMDSIGNYAFGNCSALESIDVPSGLEIISEGMFYNCQSLKSVVLPEGILELGRCAFYNCSAISEILVPGSVRKIGEYAFSACWSLSNVRFSCIDGWNAGDVNISNVKLLDRAETVHLLREVYADCIWERT